MIDTLLFILAGSFVMKLAWNGVMPYLFGLPEITFFHGLFLCGLILIVGWGFNLWKD